MVSEAWFAAYDCGCAGAAEAAPAEPPAYEEPPSYNSESASVSNTSLAAPAADLVLLILTPFPSLTHSVCDHALLLH